MENRQKNECESAQLGMTLDEQAHAELMVLSRRLRRVERVARSAVVSAGAEAEAWTRVEGHCSNALGALALAAESLPERDWSTAAGERRITVRDLSLDVSARQAWLGDADLALPRQEFSLLAMLASDPVKAWPKQELLERVWGFQARGRTRTVDTHASRLRLKLIAAGAAPGEFVVSVWGVGYALIRP